MNWDNVKKNLEQPLHPDAVKPPPQGKYGEYVEGTHCIREANRIFGHDGWSYDVATLTCTSDALKQDKHFVGYMAVIRVTVDGTVRTDVGHGGGVSKNHADAHDSSCKEAVTDGLKRALRTFGNTFGLALYEKDKSKREIGVPELTEEEKAAKRMEVAKAIAAEIKECGEATRAAIVIGQKIKAITALHKGDFPAFMVIKDAADEVGAEITITQKEAT